MADNDATLEDPDESGAFEDWIELFNPTAQAVDLSGRFLTDDVDDPTQWEFPTGSTIAAGDYLLIWADGDTEQGDNHASFKLSSGGETVALFDTDGVTLLDSIEFGAQLTDVAFGRSPDGSDSLGPLFSATPGGANSTIIATNLAPNADAGDAFTITTADTVSLDASDSEDADGEIASYGWDLNNDGNYDDATGDSVDFNSSTVGTFVVGLQVTDDRGETDTDTVAIRVTAVGDEASPWDPVLINDEAAQFFDDTYVHRVEITFDEDDWYDTLFTSHDTDPEDPYFEADFVADGIALENVGVRFKGNSSFSGPGVKKSIKIDFNEFEDLEFLGLKKLNLNNNTNDPTMLREKLFYDYASNYVEGVGRAVHTQVYINGEYYGLYTAVEQIDSTFVESRFGEDEDGNLYKGTASDDAVVGNPQADFGSDLTYLGTEQTEYEDFYELKTNETANDYSQLIEFIDVLNNTPANELADAIEPLLDVEDTLTSLALNNLFGNLDSYSGAAHNYYVYDRDDTGQFTHLFWDVNESFGTFTQFVERGENPIIIDPFWLPAGVATGPPGTPVEEESRPLAENLWAVDEYSIDYLRDLEGMLEGGFDLTSATARINELADLIRDDVSADPNKPFTTAEFEQNLTTDVAAGRRTVYGLTRFIEDRSTFLTSALSAYELEPAQAELYINEIMADNDATIEDPDEPGAFEDWIEIYNPGVAAVDLSGFYLTDDQEDPTQWEFPRGTTIDAGGYLVIWADGDTDQGENHADFKLSPGGESVLLFNNDGETLVDSIVFGEQTTDVAFGRVEDGSSMLTALSAATPGAANTNDVVVNVPPIADAGGDYTGTVGDAIALTAAASADSDGSIVSYAWDLDNDGQFETAGETATFTADIEGTFTVGLEVLDDQGARGTDTVTITIEATAVAGLVVVESNDSTLVVEGGSTDTVSVALAGQPAADVIVDLSSSDTTELIVSPSQLTFTPENWDLAQIVTVSGPNDGVVDGSQTAAVSLETSSTDPGYDSLAAIEFSTVTQDVDVSDSPARIYTPDFVLSLHTVEASSLPSAILFRAVSDADISVVPVGTASVGQSIQIVNESIAEIGEVTDGVMTADVVAGQMYAIIFEANAESRVYTVRSNVGGDAFTPSAPTNFLQPTDTNGDSVTSELDALTVINELNRENVAEGELLPATPMCDVNQDGILSAIDALLVINRIAVQRSQESEIQAATSRVAQATITTNSLATEPFESESGRAELKDQTLLVNDVNAATEGLSEVEWQAESSGEAIREVESMFSEHDLNLLAEDLGEVLALQEVSDF